MSSGDRASALGALYAFDARPLEALDASGLSRRAGQFAQGTVEHLDAIDAAISAAADTWRLERMAAVDRSILRLGTFELLYTDMAVGIIINEAVELAKEYSTAASGAFINGVLSTVAGQRAERSEPES
ncbi:MAG: transcription antitermination factor NusB [Acidimicrobiia bacterium]